MSRTYPNFNLMAKPAGPLCNLNCRYCFYLEKGAHYAEEKSHRFTMPPDIQERYIQQYIEAQEGPEVFFAFQGGEPTLAGLDYFRRFLTLVDKYLPAGKRASYSLQTNGTTLTDEWGRFLKDGNWLVGLSLDGPREIHDHYRLNKQGKGSFDQVMAGLEIVQKHGIEFNTLTVINGYNQNKGSAVYQFLKEIGSTFLQFIPIVERETAPGVLAPAPRLDEVEKDYTIPTWAVTPEGFGRFYSTVYDYWLGGDVGKIFVQLFDITLGLHMGQPASLCVYGETCGAAGIIEHTGEIFSCDHFVYPDYYLGHIRDNHVRDLFESTQQVRFGRNKQELLPRYCRECEFLSLCNGACPKHRFNVTPAGEPGLNYLCEGLKIYFRHSWETMQYMARLLNDGQPANRVMQWLRGGRPPHRNEAVTPADSVKTPRNAPCPCGSGKKYKHCHGR